jgi:hypothetical protein
MLPRLESLEIDKSWGMIIGSPTVIPDPKVKPPFLILIISLSNI